MESGKMRDFEKSEYARKSEIKPAPRRLLMLYMINELNILWRLKNFKQPPSLCPKRAMKLCATQIREANIVLATFIKFEEKSLKILQI